MRWRVWNWLVRLVVLALATGLLVVVLAPGWVLPPLAQFLDVSERPRRADYVLVLNGDPEMRPFAAAALVKVGLARQVLLTRQRLILESGAVQSGAVASELEVTQRVLRARGVPDKAIHVLPGEIASTFDEAQTLARFLESRPTATVAVVTNSFHTRRARWVIRRALGGSATQVYFAGVPRDGVDETAWWQTAHGCGVYLSEYGKLLYYWLRY